MKKYIFWTLLLTVFTASVAWAQTLQNSISLFQNCNVSYSVLFIFYLLTVFVTFWLLAPLHWKNKKRLLVISAIAPIIFYFVIFLFEIIGKYLGEQSFKGYYYGQTFMSKLADGVMSLTGPVSFLLIPLLGTIFFYRRTLASTTPEKNKFKLVAKMITPCLLKTIILIIAVYFESNFFVFLAFGGYLLIDVLLTLFMFHKKWSYFAIQQIALYLGLLYLFVFSLIPSFSNTCNAVYSFSWSPYSLILLFPIIDMIFIMGVFHKSWKYYAVHISLYTLLYVLYFVSLYWMASL